MIKNNEANDFQHLAFNFLSFIQQNLAYLCYYFAKMEKGQVTLFTHFRSGASWRVRIALNLKQVPHKFQFVDLQKGQQKTEQFKAVNPAGTVPALKLPQGQIITESVAICQYLEQVSPKNPLLPKDPIKRAQVRSFCEIINSGITPYENIRRFTQNTPKEEHEKQAQFVKASTFKGLATVQAILQKNKGKYTFGEQVTLGDVFLAPFVDKAVHKYKVQLTTYPRINQIIGNLSKIDAFKQAKPKNQPDHKQ